MDQMEVNLVWDEEAPSQVEDTAESEERDVYDDNLTAEQWHALFSKSNNEEDFLGFCSFKSHKMAPLGATKYFNNKGTTQINL